MTTAVASSCGTKVSISAVNSERYDRVMYQPSGRPTRQAVAVMYMNDLTLRIVSLLTVPHIFYGLR